MGFILLFFIFTPESLVNLNRRSSKTFVVKKMVKLIPIKIECHSGYKADEYPVCFYYEDNKYEIREITDRWYQSDWNPQWPRADYFKVLTASLKQYIIKHDLENDLWYIVSDKI